ncbi:MAG TPA: hypothetical protein DCL72_09555 [Rhizobiales bacterium]|jgi:hypothetical protein|nr:hypothetical protein [Hyphomicrobiales bacterium]HAN62403.1 hypothetical protein [Hyphomicrobiales bacterium]HBR27023.1 hypothetical protein [Hyphomicrobiales bacterium]HCL62976.1 hypothetical protein [Hyphomicrobiales bacterium]
MFADEKRGVSPAEIHEDVSREDIVAAFRSAMVGHFRSHVPGTNINESTLLASDYLNHFHELVMLFEAIASEPQSFADDLLSWRPLTYEEHFSESGFRDKNLAIAAYRRAPPRIRARFDEAVARLHGEALTLVAEVASELGGGKRLDKTCASAAARLRVLIDEANAIANGETLPDRKDPDTIGDVGGQAAIDALFGTR